MTTLLNKTYLRTLHHLPDNARAVWLFEDAPTRTRASAQSGIRIYSAYKTLLCTIRENGLLADTPSVDIHYPVVAGDDPMRFRLECYPLPELYPHCAVHFHPAPCARDEAPAYTLAYPDGRRIRIPVPVRWRKSADGRDILAACGWIEYTDGHGEALYTDYEQLYDDTCALMQNLPLTPLPGESARGPFFHRLQIDIRLPAQDQPLPIGEEHLSLAEALHEDLYFSGLDIFRARLHLPAHDRSLTPGQILPDIRTGDTPQLHIHLPAPNTPSAPSVSHGYNLDHATHWLTPADIEHSMRALGGEPIPAQSRQGRNIPARYIQGKSPAALAISAGQHANESSGIIAALRAARDLKQQGELSFTLRPLGNPDGYAAFIDLCAAHPRHMHHAARYTASGCDLAYGEHYETALCRAARTRLPAAWLHINLHGYPAHEWTVPLSGYVPHGFSRWTIPKGYFLICRHHPDWQNTAEHLMQHLLAALAGHPAQITQNQHMLARYTRIIGSADFALAHGCIPYQTETHTNGEYPIEIITEAPDETTYGETYRIAHESHYRILMAAAQYLLTHS